MAVLLLEAKGIGALIRCVERDSACADLELDSGREEKRSFLTKTWNSKHTPAKLIQIQEILNEPRKGDILNKRDQLDRKIRRLFRIFRRKIV